MPPITSQYFFFSQDGLMWFSTAHGLTSFDGSDIVYHSSLQEANRYELNKINVMIEDEDHNFYIGTRPCLLFYDRKTKKFVNIPYTFTDNHKAPEIGSIALFFDKNGVLYSGSAAQGLFIYDPVKKEVKHYNLDASKTYNWVDRRFNTVSSFAAHATDSNKLWVGTYHGIYLFDKKEKKFSQNFEIVTDIRHKYTPVFDKDKQFIDVSRMDLQGDSLVWFNSWAGGFAKYNTQTGKATIVFGRDALYKSKDVYYGYYIAGFIRLSGQKFLIGIFNGKTAIYDTRSNTATYFNVNGLDDPYEQTRYINYDKVGNIWVLQKGLLYTSVPENLRLNAVKTPNNLTGFSYVFPRMRGVYFDTASRLFYTCFQGSIGVHLYDQAFVQRQIIPTSIINNSYNYGTTVDVRITKDGSGRFWTVGWKTHVLMPGEKKFSLVEKKFHQLAWLGKEDRFYDIVTTRDGNILFKQSGGLIYHVNHITLAADTIRCPVIKADAVEIKDASSWYDRKRNLVYLTRREGVAQFSLDKKEMGIIPYSSLFGNLPPYQSVCAPALDAEGKIWFMIPKYGVRIIDPVSLLCIDSIQYGNRGLMRGDYTAIVGGSDHYILFRSQNGIVVYDFAKQQSFLFDWSNGLSSPENVSLLYSNGHVFIGQADRFEYFKLSDLDSYTTTIAPYLNSISADTVQVYTRTGLGKDNTIMLPYFQNTLAFSLSAPEFLFPERIEYAYQLAPLEKDWNYTNYFNRKIIYTKLPPGEYTFRLKSQMQGGNWDTKTVEYTLVISPAWWQTGLFKLLCIIVGIAILVYLIQRRIWFMRKTEKERSKHEKELLELEAKALRAQMNPHFIFNSLNSIKSLINKNENDKAAEYLTTFSKLIRTLFQNSDKREISLYEELETCKLYTQLEKMRFANKVDFVFDIDELLDLKDIKVPALILQPFIENAIWHGLVTKEQGGKVIILVKEKNGGVECIIDDNGIGRELSQQYKTQYRATHESKGIGLTQSRLELDKLLNEREDTIRIVDKRDNEGHTAGTTVIITFKEK